MNKQEFFNQKESISKENMDDKRYIIYLFNRLKPISRNKMMKVLYFSNAYVRKVSECKLFTLKVEVRDGIIVFPSIYDNWDNIDDILKQEYHYKCDDICSITKNFLDEVCEFFLTTKISNTFYDASMTSYISPSSSLPCKKNYFKSQSPLYSRFGEEDDERKFINFIERKDYKRRAESLKTLNSFVNSHPLLLQ